VKEIIETNNAPKAIGPYSQATRTDFYTVPIQHPKRVIFTAGQIPIDPATGQMVEGGIKEQTRRVLLNISAILSATGATTNDVLKTTVFMVNLDDFSKMNEVYGQFFPSEPPARSTIEVSRLPKGALVEIEAIAEVYA
jgi:2-iminobutanoate/2-iminopropanoate deaminase